MHNIHFRPGICPSTRPGSLRRSPKPPILDGKGDKTSSYTRRHLLWDKVVLEPGDYGFLGSTVALNVPERRGSSRL